MATDATGLIDDFDPLVGGGYWRGNLEGRGAWDFHRSGLLNEEVELTILFPLFLENMTHVRGPGGHVGAGAAIGRYQLD
jgi:hypothetical protein